MTHNRLPRILKTTAQQPEEIRGDFWMCETGMGQQVTKMMMMTMMRRRRNLWNFVTYTIVLR